MTDSPVADIGLGHLLHGEGGLHPHLQAQLLQSVGHCQRVHHRGQHTDLVSPGALHIAAGTAAPEVAAAHNDADFGAHIVGLFDTFADALDGGNVQAEALIPCQRFAAEFE